MTDIPWLKSALMVFVLGFAAGPVYGQTRIAEADRFVKLGTRLPPLPPGEGGQLLVTAPQELCVDDGYLLQLSLLPPGSYQPVVRVPSGPSLCRWNFEGLPTGEYDALIQFRRDEQIVAMARGQVVRGGSTSLTLEPVDVEVEGVVTASDGGIDRATLKDQSLIQDLRLVFKPADSYQHAWTTPLEADGTFRVKLDFYSAETRFCVSVEHARPLNQILLRCGELFQGLQRFDFDTDRIPQGVIRINVPSLDDAPFDAFVSLMVSPSEETGGSFIRPFKPLRGIHGDYLAGYGEYEIAITSFDKKRVLALSRITLSSDRPVADVKLAITEIR